MKVKSAEFKKGIVGDDDILSEPLPQIAFVGRSNVGKSSVINTLADKKELAKSSSVPGRTQQINFFLINKSFYLVDLPGYGYAKGSHEKRDAIIDLIHWYIQNPNATQHAVVLIVDAKVGPTDNDLKMLALLEGQGKKIIVVANKIDKLKTNEQTKSIRTIEKSVNGHLVIPYSAEKRIGLGQLTQAITQGLKL